MELTEIRNEIDKIDLQLRELLMRRMDQSVLAAKSKFESGAAVYQPQRESEILRYMPEGVPEDRLVEYMSIVRRIIEAARTYQYDLIYDMMTEKPTVKGGELLKAAEGGKPARVRVKFSRADVTNSLASILGMLGDNGCNLNDLEVLNTSIGAKTAMRSFEIVFSVEMSDDNLNKLMYQLAMETTDFEIIACSRQLAVKNFK